MAIADGDGIAFYDANNPAAPRFIGAQNIGGVAWDLLFTGSSLIAANDLGIAIIDRVYAPPTIAPTLINISSDGASTATVSGSTLAISPAAASVILKNATTGAVATATPTAGGSFMATVAARAGQRISLTATDSANRSAVRSIGAVPFVTTIRNDAAVISGDTAFQARRVAVDGSNWIVTNGTLSGLHINGGSSRALLFRQPDASAPAQITSFDTTAGTIEDLTTRNGNAVVVGDRLATINMIPTPPTVQSGSHVCGHELGIAIAGNNAFSAQTDNCVAAGGINIYDIANPLAPIFIRSQSTTINGIVYRALIPLGTQYLIAISPDKSAGAGHDVTVIDRSNLNSLTKVTDLDIPNFDAFAAVLDGTTLYLAGGDAGIAIVDLTNPSVSRLEGHARYARNRAIDCCAERERNRGRRCWRTGSNFPRHQRPDAPDRPRQSAITRQPGRREGRRQPDLCRHRNAILRGQSPLRLSAPSRPLRRCTD